MVCLQLYQRSQYALGLNHYVRRVFLDGGKEVQSLKSIPNESKVFISMGENYKDPHQFDRGQCVCVVFV